METCRNFIIDKALNKTFIEKDDATVPLSELITNEPSHCVFKDLFAVYVLFDTESKNWYCGCSKRVFQRIYSHVYCNETGKGYQNEELVQNWKEAGKDRVGYVIFYFKGDSVEEVKNNFNTYKKEVETRLIASFRTNGTGNKINPKRNRKYNHGQCGRKPTNLYTCSVFGDEEAMPAQEWVEFFDFEFKYQDVYTSAKGTNNSGVLANGHGRIHFFKVNPTPKEKLYKEIMNKKYLLNQLKKEYKKTFGATFVSVDSLKKNANTVLSYLEDSETEEAIKKTFDIFINAFERLNTEIA